MNAATRVSVAPVTNGGAEGRGLRRQGGNQEEAGADLTAMILCCGATLTKRSCDYARL